MKRVGAIALGVAAIAALAWIAALQIAPYEVVSYAAARSEWRLMTATHNLPKLPRT